MKKREQGEKHNISHFTGLNEFEILSSEKWCNWDGSFEFRRNNSIEIYISTAKIEPIKYKLINTYL